MSVEDGSAERLTAALDQRLDGLLTEISRSDRPLVWVWAWPGSGVRRLVARLLDSSGETAALVGRRPAALPEALAAARAEGAHRFVLANDVHIEERSDVVPEALDVAPFDSWCGAFADLLRFGEQAIIASARPPELADAERALVLTMGPGDLRLGPEALRAWRGEAGATDESRNDDVSVPRDEAWAALELVTAGWYQAIVCAGEAGLLSVDASGGPSAGPDREVESAPSRLARAWVDALVDAPGWRRFVARRLAGWLPLAEKIMAEPGGVTAPMLLQRLLEDRRISGSGTRAEASPGQAGGVDVGDPSRMAVTTGRQETEIQLELFGVPELALREGDRSRRAIHLPHRRLMVLLALLSTGESAHRDRDELLEALWPQLPVDRALRSLRPALSHLRRLLQPHTDGAVGRKLEVIGRRGRSYRLGGDVRWAIDVAVFRQLTQKAAALPAVSDPFQQSTLDEVAADPQWASGLRQRGELLSSAWKLYRGDFLAGHDVSPWVERERLRWRRSWQTVLRDLGSTLAALGETDRALDAFRVLLQSDPTLEEVHLDVIRIYLLQGRRHLARRQWERLCERLLFELDSRPLDETVRVYSALMG